MKKVLIITYYWPPSGGPGVQRHLKLSKYLPESNIEPIIVTVDPNKASYPLIDLSLSNEINPNLKVFKTYSLEFLNLYSKIFPGRSIPKPGFSDEDNPGILQMIARYIRGNCFVPDIRKGWNYFALKRCRELIKKYSFSAIITSSPPHSTQLIGLKLKQEFGVPWIADLRDPWTDIYYNRNLYRSRIAQNKDKILEASVLEKADIIITVSDSLKSLFQSKSAKVNPGKIFIIPNGYDISDFLNKPKYSGNQFIISYIGTLSKEYPISSFILAVKQLIEKYSADDIRINFLGQISEHVIRQFDDAGLNKALLNREYAEHNEAINLMLQSSILLLIIPDVDNNEGILTGKLFEYLASRRPIMFFGPKNSDAAKIIQECNSGEVFAYEESFSAFIWLEKLYFMHRNRSSFESGNEKVEMYSRVKQSKMLAEIINRISN